MLRPQRVERSPGEGLRCPGEGLPRWPPARAASGGHRGQAGQMPPLPWLYTAPVSPDGQVPAIRKDPKLEGAEPRLVLQLINCCSPLHPARLWAWGSGVGGTAPRQRGAGHLAAPRRTHRLLSRAARSGVQSSLLWLAVRGVARGPGSTSAHAGKVAGGATSGSWLPRWLRDSSRLCPWQSRAPAEWDSRPSSRTTPAGMPGWARPPLPLPEGVLGRQGCFRGALRKGSAALGLGGRWLRGVLSGVMEAPEGLVGILPLSPGFPLATGRGFRRALQMLR